MFGDKNVDGTTVVEEIDVDPLDQFSEKLEAFKTFAKNDQAAADAIFESLGGKGKVEQEMLLQLGAWKPLYKPERFDDAHHVAMRALEVLYRNGHRKAPLKLSVFTPVAQYSVQLVTRFVVRDHVKNVVNSIDHLYTRRWASAPRDTPDARMLRRAWFYVEKVRAGYKGKSLGLPTFVLGGAFVSSLTGLLSNLFRSGTLNKWLLIILAMVLYLVMIALAYGIIKGSAIARRRIKMSLDQPLRNLWDVVGAACNPPKDQAIQFAMVSLIIMAVTALGIPIVATILILAN